MAPPHRGVGPQPAGRRPFVAGVPEDSEEPTPGTEPTGHFSEEGSMVLARNVDEGVEGDDRRKVAHREIHIRKVSQDESRSGDETPGPAHLHIRNVHSGHPEPPSEEPRGRDARSRAQVQDLRARRKVLQQRGQPVPIIVPSMAEDIRAASTGAVPVGGAVPPLAHRRRPIRPREGPFPSAGERHAMPMFRGRKSSSAPSIEGGVRRSQCRPPAVAASGEARAGSRTPA